MFQGAQTQQSGWANGSESDSESGCRSCVYVCVCVCTCASGLIGNCLVEALHLKYFIAVYECHLGLSHSHTWKFAHTKASLVIPTFIHTHTLLHEKTGKHPDLNYVTTYILRRVRMLWPQLHCSEFFFLCGQIFFFFFRCIDSLLWKEYGMLRVISILYCRSSAEC